MSIVVEFFRAPSRFAAAALADGRAGAFETLQYGSFDADETLTSWEAILAGLSFAEVLDDEQTDSSLLDHKGGEEALLLELSPTLQARLAAATCPCSSQPASGSAS